MGKKPEMSIRRSVGAWVEKPLRWFDFVILGGLLLVLFLSFEMRDLFHTAGCSYGFLDGHFLDFYDYLSANGIGEDGSIGLHASYLPTVYWLFAIWNLPMKLFGIVPRASAALGFLPIMWAKILPCLAFFASGWLVYRIGLELGMDAHKAKLLLFAYITMPIALFDQFILGQYESFTVFFMLLGFYAWLRRRDLQFVLWFAVAMTLKYTVLVFFLPLLLLRQKDFLKILLSLMGSFLLVGAEVLLYSGSPAFKAYLFGVGGAGDQPTGYIFNAAYFTGFEANPSVKFVVYLTVLAFVLVSAMAYFQQTVSKEEEGQYSLYFLCLAAAALFGFSKWHPQWLMLAVPFWTISAFRHKHTKILMVLDMLFGMVFVAFCPVYFRAVTDEVMLENGIFKYILPGGKVGDYFSMGGLFGKLDPSLLLTLITAVILVYGIFKHPKFQAVDANVTVDSSMGWIRARYLLPMAMFLIPAFLCVFFSVNSPAKVYEEKAKPLHTVMAEDEVLSQRFTAGKSVSKVVLPIARGSSFSDGTLRISLVDPDGKEAAAAVYDIAGLTDPAPVVFAPGIAARAGEPYTLQLSVTDVTGESTFCLFGAPEEAEAKQAEKNGRTVDFHLSMTVYE